MATAWWLGPAGSLVQLPNPQAGYSPGILIKAGTHDLLGGGHVQDRLGIRRRFTLTWPWQTDTNHVIVAQLVRALGPFRYLDGAERNQLTANQSTGTDDLRTTEGFSARTQGTISSSTAQFRSGQRSAAWATGSALGSTNRGFVLATSTTVDDTWTAVRPSTAYTISGYLRTTAAVSIKAGFEWYDSAGAIIGSAVFGTGTALSTSNFTTQVTHTATSPSTAAYGLGLFLNSNTTGGAITVYLDEAQIEEAGSVNAWRVGAGTPSVAVEGYSVGVQKVVTATGATHRDTELTLLEL
jgi:hypothetical protein